MIVSSIKTERLVLRPLRVSDADEMATVLADDSLYVFTGGEPPTVSELANRYEQQTAGSGTPGEHWCNWIIRVGSQGRPVALIERSVAARAVRSCPIIALGSRMDRPVRSAVLDRAETSTSVCPQRDRITR